MYELSSVSDNVDFHTQKAIIFLLLLGRWSEQTTSEIIDGIPFRV
jgi:hypothetical protein